jgi:hypothetical protein
MRHIRSSQNRPSITLTTFAILFAVEGAAQAQAEEPGEPPDPATPPAAHTPEVEPAHAPAAAGGASPASAALAAAPAGAPFIEQMGPETFPGRLRGLEGGSLWLEPSFHGLQWPLNTRTGVGMSGNVWVDGGYERIIRDQDQIPNTTLNVTQGRGLLRVTPGYVDGDFFMQGQIELVGNLCQATTDVCKNLGTFSTDDLWVRVGQKNLWDLKIGRFAAWEIYHLGLAMDPYTVERLGAGMLGVDSNTSPKLEAPTVYGVSYLRERPTDGAAVGYGAFHLYPTEFLRFEVLGKAGTDNYRSDNSTADTPYNYLGGRLAAILDMGWLKLKMGGEYQTRSSTTQTIEPGTPGHKKDAVAERSQMGAGASLQFVFDPTVEFGLNAAIGKQSDVDAMGRDVLENSYTTKSAGVFANVRPAGSMLVGVGANWTEVLDRYLADKSTVNNYTSQLQGFLAFQYALAQRFYVKAVLSGARAGFQPSALAVPVWNNYEIGGRVRLMYLF